MYVRKPNRKFLTSGEFADAIGVDRCTVQKWDNNGTLPAHHTTPGGYRQYSREQIDKYFNGEYGRDNESESSDDKE